MRNIMKWVALGTAWVFLAGVDSCSAQFNGPTFVTDLQLQNTAGTQRREFAPGETIVMQLTVRNRGRTSAILQFTTGHQFDFVTVDDSTSNVRWRWSAGKEFIQGTSELEFEAGETKTFTVNWNQVADTGQVVGPGNYEARGVLMFSEFASNPLKENQLGSPVRSFAIR